MLAIDTYPHPPLNERRYPKEKRTRACPSPAVLLHEPGRDDR